MIENVKKNVRATSNAHHLQLMISLPESDERGLFKFVCVCVCIDKNIQN